MSDGFLKVASLSFASDVAGYPKGFLGWADQVSGNLGDFIQIGNLPAGPLGTGAATVDLAGFLLVAETTAGPVALTIPFPTNLSPGRRVVVANNGSQTFTLNGVSMAINVATQWVWQGAGWLHIV